MFVATDKKRVSIMPQHQPTIALRPSAREAFSPNLCDLPIERPSGWLKFFQGFLEDDDEMLARDAYDEFAKAPYEAVKQLKPKNDVQACATNAQSLHPVPVIDAIQSVSIVQAVLR